MSLTVPGSLFASRDNLPINVHHRLHRRSSCPSIPRSVSICSSINALDSSSEDLRNPVECGEIDIYKSPLFRDLGVIGEAHDEAARQVSAMPTGDFTLSAEAICCDNNLSDSLSNYQFVITGHEDVPEPPKASEDYPRKQPLIPNPSPPVVPNKPSNLKISQPLPPRHFSPSLKHSLPSVPPMVTGPTIPPSTGTRPLQIDRSRKRQESSSTRQRTAGADAQYVQPLAKPIRRAATQANLRETYRRAGTVPERKVHAMGAKPTAPHSFHTQPKTLNPNTIEVIYNHGLICVL